MRITLLLFISLLLMGCDQSYNYSDRTDTSYVDGTLMTVKTLVVNESTTFECIESQSGLCYFKVSSQRCSKESAMTTCVVVHIDSFELQPGKAKEFKGVNIKEKFLHCASALKF